MALRFRRALRASVLYGSEARKVQKIIGDTVGNENQVRETLRLVEEVTYDLTSQSVPRPDPVRFSSLIKYF